MEDIMKTYVISKTSVPEKMKVYGLLPDLTRMPRDAAKAVSPAVEDLSLCPSGGRVRFMTDSPFISIRVNFISGGFNNGCDVVCDGVYRGKIAGEEEDLTISGVITLAPEGISAAGVRCMRLVTVFFPRTAPVDSIEISLSEDSSIDEAPSYAIEKPIVFYGSSITMGASSKSPSLAYTARVAERLGADHINLGFGGNAKGERAMAEYIAGLEMSAFVMDYEHNADTLDYLRETHKPFFDIIRAAQPELPILIVSRPDTDREFLRSCYGRRIVMDTFHASLDAGDRLVDYVDGFYLFGNCDRDKCVIEDNCHPNEHGFEMMADTVAPRLKSLMERDPKLNTMGRDGADADFPTHI